MYQIDGQCHGPASGSCQRVNLELYVEERVQSLRVLFIFYHESKIKSACVVSMVSATGTGLETKRHFILKVIANATGRLRMNLHDFARFKVAQ